MGTLESLTNTKGQSILTPVNPDGTARHLLGISGQDVSQDADAGWLGVATHQIGGVVNSGVDGVVVQAGKDQDGNAKPLPSGGGPLVDQSGTITSGGDAQTLMAANPDRRYLFILNDKDETEDLWFDFTTAADVVSPSIRLVPGASFVMEAGFVSTELISVIAATTAHVFTAKEG